MIPGTERVAVSGVLMTVSGAFVIGALQLSATAGRVPLIVAALTSVLLILQTGRALRPAKEHAVDPEAGALASRERATLAWMTALFGGLWAGGILIALPTYMALHLRWRADKSWVVAAVAAAATAAVLVIGVELFLGIPLYQGALRQWLTRQ